MRNLSLVLAILFSSDVSSESLRPFITAEVKPHRDASLSTQFSGGVVFEAADEQHGLELWWTDGTSENTQRLTDSVAGSGDGVCEPSQSHTRLFVFQEHVYFFGRNGSVADLWRVNRQGEAELVRPLGLECPDTLSLVVDGELRTETGQLFLIAPASRSQGAPSEAALWRVELPSGVAVVPAFPALGWYVAGVHVVWNGDVYVRLYNGSNRFARLDEVTGSFDVVVPDVSGAHYAGSYDGRMILGGSLLRSSNGYAAGTMDLTTQGAVNARRGVELNGIYYLSAALGGLNSELWRTDGTQAGTYVVRELVDYGFAGLAGDPVVFDGKLALFREQYSSLLASTLHESDGTFEGTKEFVFSDPALKLYRREGAASDMISLGNSLFIMASSSGPSGTAALWEVSSGTHAAKQLSTPLTGAGLTRRIALINDRVLVITSTGSIAALHSFQLPLFADDFECC